MDPEETNEQQFYSLKRLANTYKTLEKRKGPIDQDFVIYAYFLYSDIKDGVHGKQIYLGAYPTKKRALEEVEDIIKQTGHDSIYVTESCNWEDIDEKKRPDRTLYMDPQTKSEDLEAQYRSKILKEVAEEEKREFITKELEEQLKNELDHATMEYYAHNWFNAIRNKSLVEYHRQQMKYYDELYMKRVDKVRQQYLNQPEIEDTWLNVYEKRLTRRGEEDVFIMLREGHRMLKDEVLGKKGEIEIEKEGRD